MRYNPPTSAVPASTAGFRPVSEPPDSQSSAYGIQTRRVWGAGVGLLFVAHVVYLNCVAEDAFIAFRFARNLAHGHGLVWNAGEAPVEGYTDFLWVLLSAAAIRLGLPVVAFAQAVGIAAGAATLWLTYRAARRQLDLPPAAAIVCPLLLAAAGPFATWASSGMEMTLFAFLAVLGTCLAADAWRRRRPAAAALSALAFVAATLTRPEGAMLAALLLGGATLLSLRDRRRFVSFGVASAIYGLLFGIYFVWRYSRYGYLLPNTFYAKTGGGRDQVLRGGLLAFIFFMQFALPLLPMALLAIWERGLSDLAARAGRLRLGLERRPLATCSAAVVVAYSAYNVAVGGDYMAMHRFFVPVLPFIYLLFALVAGAVYGRVRTRENAAGYAVVMAVITLWTFFPSTPLERSFFFTPPQQHGDYRGVQIERWHVARLSTIGRFFDGYRRDPSESLATSAIGAIGYYADMRILDVHGLVDTHIAHLPPPPGLGWHRPGHGREDLAYTLSLRPTYLMFSRDLTPAPLDLWRHVPEGLRDRVDREYVHQSVPLTDTVNRQAGYFTFFERRDSAGRRSAAGSPGPSEDAQRR